MQRDKAWDVHEYPCIGRFTWLRLEHFQFPEMKTAVARMQAPGSTDTLLELACCVGQTIRQLVALGIESDRLYASDLHPEFISIGFELFRDEDRIRTVFAAGDMLAPDDPNLKAMDGKVSLIHAASFFHLFTWNQQLVIGKRIVRLLRPDRTDNMLFGHQIGSVLPGEKARLRGGGSRYLHDQSSFQRLWDEVGAATGTRWNVDVVELSPLPIPIPSFGDDSRIIRYSVQQLPPA